MRELPIVNSVLCSHLDANGLCCTPRETNGSKNLEQERQVIGSQECDALLSTCDKCLTVVLSIPGHVLAVFMRVISIHRWEFQDANNQNRYNLMSNQKLC